MNHVITNTVKNTKEMITNFPKIPEDESPVTVNNKNVEIVEEYKNLGTRIHDKLKGSSKVRKVCVKANQRLYCIRKLKDVMQAALVPWRSLSAVLKKL